MCRWFDSALGHQFSSLSCEVPANLFLQNWPLLYNFRAAKSHFIAPGVRLTRGRIGALKCSESDQGPGWASKRLQGAIQAKKSMLPEFDAALETFQQDAWTALRHHTFDAHTERVNVEHQIDAQNLAGDVAYLAMVLRDLHVVAVGEASRWYDEGAEDMMSDSMSLSIQKFIATFKSFLFVVRAFQDAMCRTGCLIYQQGVGRKYTSMNHYCPVNLGGAG